MLNEYFCLHLFTCIHKTYLLEDKFYTHTNTCPLDDEFCFIDLF